MATIIINPLTGQPTQYVAGFICKLGTCDIKQWGFVHYQPSLPGNGLYLGIFSILFFAQFYLQVKHSVGTVGRAMLLGIFAEGTGYVARMLLHGNPFDRTTFIIYLLCLTLGPVFIAAAIYLCLGRIVVVYGEGISPMKPRSYSVFFLLCDFIALCCQATGGAIASSFPVTNKYMIDLGTHILVAGLSFQVASLFAFMVCSVDFLRRVHKHKDLRNPAWEDLWSTKKFKTFLIATCFATTLLFIRTVFRAVELSQGFGGKLANSEVEFMILDGVMVILACITLTVFHPGRVFGTKRWGEADYPFFRKTVPRQGAGMELAQTVGKADEEENVAGVEAHEMGDLGSGKA